MQGSARVIIGLGYRHEGVCFHAGDIGSADQILWNKPRGETRIHPSKPGVA